MFMNKWPLKIVFGWGGAMMASLLDRRNGDGVTFWLPRPSLVITFLSAYSQILNINSMKINISFHFILNSVGIAIITQQG
jgi:hypothetical protein